jgi:hypothetical protein
MKPVYSIDAFAAGTNFFICIATPYEEPDVKISGTYEHGKEIKIEKSSLKGPMVIICLYTLGFLTCFFYNAHNPKDMRRCSPFKQTQGFQRDAQLNAGRFGCESWCNEADHKCNREP